MRKDVESSLDRRCGPRVAILLGIALLAGHAIHDGSLIADESLPGFQQAAPEELGLLLPDAPPRPGRQRRVVVSYGNAPPTVGEIYLEVGNRFVVLLPNGRLISVLQDQAIETDREFQPLDQQQLIANLQADFPGFRNKSTRHYICIFNGEKEFAVQTARILETMYPAVQHWCRNHGLSASEPRFPMVVLIFANEEEYQRYHKVPENVVAYYNSVTNYVVMYEQRKLAAASPEIAFKQSVSTIAHEGAHQILHNIGVQQRLSRWPVWFSEGLAEYFAPTEVKDRIRWKGVGLPNDLRLRELREFFKRNDRHSTFGQLLRQTVESRSLNSLGYAMSWSTVDYLAKRQKRAFDAYLKDVSAIAPLETRLPAELFIKHIGTDFVELENKIWQHIADLPYQDPVENQVHIVAFRIVGPDDRKEAIATPSYQKAIRFVQQADTRRYWVRFFPNRTLARRFADKWLRN